jgi:hypothetical protein
LYFNDGVHAITWLFNDAQLLSSPGCITEGILNKLKNSLGDSAFTEGTEIDDEYHARDDLINLFKQLKTREQALLYIYMSDSMRGAKKFILSSLAWRKWRRYNNRSFDDRYIPWADLLFETIAKWEDILIENDYIAR